MHFLAHGVDCEAPVLCILPDGSLCGCPFDQMPICLFPESGVSAMYIKVRPMTGGDPATITVSKLTTIQELRVGSDY